MVNCIFVLLTQNCLSFCLKIHVFFVVGIFVCFCCSCGIFIFEMKLFAVSSIVKCIKILILV